MNVSEKAELALRVVKESKVLAFDVETSGLDWKRNFPVGWVITNDDVSVYVPTRHGGGGNLPAGGDFKVPTVSTGPYSPHPWETELAKAFDIRRASRQMDRTIGHHIKFDAHFAMNVGVKLGRHLTCTMNIQALLDEHTRSFSLENLTKQYGVSAKLSTEMYEAISKTVGVPNNKNAMGSFWLMPGDHPNVVGYSEGDGTSTLQLYRAQMKEMERQDAEPFAWIMDNAKVAGEDLATVEAQVAQLVERYSMLKVKKVEDDVIWTLLRMERVGVKLDIDYLESLDKRLKAEVEEAKQTLPPGFNPLSNSQIMEYVSKYRTDWPTTALGNPSFTAKWLLGFPEGKGIVALRKWSNLSNSFIRPLIDEHSFRGRVHTQFNQNRADDYGTISGRLSSSNPNLQQIPKHDKELAPMFRKGFVADEGFLLYEADYSQMEPRMFAHYSNEPALVDGYNAVPPKDVHTVVAELFHADRNTVAKRMNMGMFTGMFPKSFAGHMGLSLEEATTLWNKWFEQFPKIKIFQDEAKSAMLSRGFVRSVLNRRGRMESRKFAYKAVSRIIQNGGADVIKYKLIEIDRMLEDNFPEVNLLVPVHDSILWQAPDNQIGQKASQEITKMMEDVQGPPFNFRVPFATDVGSGINWAEASFG